MPSILTIPKLIYNNKFNLPSLPPLNSFEGQTVLVTGATGGIGLAAAVHFVNLGASTVIITARTLSKGQSAKESILSQTGAHSKDVVQVMVLDMSTFAGVETFANQVKKEVKEIDYVCLNAGTLQVAFKLGEEGYEETIQINVLSTALLAILLLPWMKVAGKGKAHLGFVTSGLHKEVDISPGKFPQTNIIAHFSKPENWPGDMYPTSKLLEQYVVSEIAELALGPDGRPQVIVNPMCPGMVKSDLARGYRTNPLMSVMVWAFMALLSKTTEGGARTLVRVGTTKAADHGKYFDLTPRDETYKTETEKTIWSSDGRKVEKEVWKEIVQILDERVPELKEIGSST